MKSVVRFSLKQIVFLNVVFVILVVAGLFSLFTSPLENMPPVDIGQAFVQTVYYGASAEDVENLVTDKLEDALDGLENVEYVQSWSRRNVSSINVKFIDDTDYRSLYDELRFRILNARKELPPEVDEPYFLYIDTNTWMPVLVVNLLGDLPNRSLKLLGDELKASLIEIPGVMDVEVSGEYVKEFHVSLDSIKLRRYGVTFQQVADAVQAANTKLPSGRFRQGPTECMLDTGTRLCSQEDVLNVVVRRDGDAVFIRVRDLVTQAVVSHRDPDVISSVNGEDSLRLIVKKENSGNSIQIAEAVRDLSQQFEAIHEKDGIRVVLTQDSTIEIRDSINTLSGNLILGMFFVACVLWFTLGFRNAMLTAIGIPFSFLCALTVMRFTGLSLNTISLFSFVLVSGIIVDDAVIVVENVYRHTQMGKDLSTAIVDGASEVMLPVISSALTTILAFIPMLIMTGSTGEFFSVIPKTVSYALAASLLEALFLLPMHIYDWGPRSAPVHGAEDPGNGDFQQHLSRGLFAPFWKLYRRILDVLLAHKLKTLLVLLGAFISAVAILTLSVTGILPLIRVEFFPGNYARYHVAITMPPGTSVERTDEEVRNLSRFIMSLGEKQALSTAGLAGMLEDEDYRIVSGSYYGQVVVTLPEQSMLELPKNPKNDPMKHLDFMRERIRDFIDSRHGADEPKPFFKVFAENTGPPTGKAVNIRVSGSERREVLRGADAIMAYLKSEPEFVHLKDLEDDRAVLRKVARFVPRQDKAFEFDLSPGAITSIVAGALNGRYAGEFRSSGEEFDLLVRLARADDPGNGEKIGLSEPADLMEVPVIEHSAFPVFVRDLVDLEYAVEEDSRGRYNGKPTVTVASDIADGAMLSPSRVQLLVKRFFDQKAYEFPGVTIAFGGEFESTNRAYTSLMFAFVIAVMGIYMVLASQFRSYIQPMMIISAIGFAFIGVVFGMFLTRSTFTLGSFLAVVGLAGVAVNDSLILIDFMNVRKRQGKPLREAVIDGCAARMRPVLITTVTTILGLLPMAIGIPHKSIAWAPMATAFVTGLSSATILALLIIPVEYELWEKVSEFFARRRKKTKGIEMERTDD